MTPKYTLFKLLFLKKEKKSTFQNFTANYT